MKNEQKKKKERNIFPQKKDQKLLMRKKNA